jgi:dihydroflavonol-4-reductase
MAPEETQTPLPTTVLVTGGSGFVASQLILQLLAAGYTVRSTVRGLERGEEVRKWLQDAGTDTDDRLSFFAADLTKDKGWADAFQGCTYVHHVASPFPPDIPKSEDDLIVPARDGTLRVLRAARDAGIKRVVLTSSFAAVGYGQSAQKQVFTEENWSILDGKIPVPPYHKSKTITERAAWDFVKKEGGNLELAVINPVGIFGPVLSADFSPSIQIVKKLMDGSVAGCPQISFGIVDVRDLADLHIRAMLDPAAKNERFIGVNDDGPVSMFDIAKTIKKNRPLKAQKVPTKQLSNWLVRTVGFFDPSVRQIVPQLGDVKNCSNEKAKSVLGWTPRSTAETILDTVDSLVQHNIV